MHTNYLFLPIWYLWFMTKTFFMAKYMSCLRTSAMFISSHSIYLDLVIWTVFCQLGVTLLLMTKPSLIWKTPLFEEIQQIIFLIDLVLTLGTDKYGFICLMYTIMLWHQWMSKLFGHTSEILSRNINLTLDGYGKSYCHLGIVSIHSFQYA